MNNQKSKENYEGYIEFTLQQPLLVPIEHIEDLVSILKYTYTYSSWDKAKIVEFSERYKLTDSPVYAPSLTDNREATFGKMFSKEAISAAFMLNVITEEN